ncbi:GNAT family N-acetyltransferase [Larkinella harenae]
MSRSVLETSMGLTVSTFELNADSSFIREFEEAIEPFIIPNIAAYPEHWLWYTHWLIVHREYNLTIGGMGAAGPPNADGQVMIGYFIDRKFEGQQYTTEAVTCFLNWIFQHPDVTTVVADTPAEHFASQRVLQKNGFELVGEVEEGLRWQRERFR